MSGSLTLNELPDCQFIKSEILEFVLERCLAAVCIPADAPLLGFVRSLGF